MLSLFIYLSFHWLNYSRSRTFELVIQGFELVNRGFELVTRKVELATCESELVDLNTHFWILTRAFNLVTSNC